MDAQLAIAGTPAFKCMGRTPQVSLSIAAFLFGHAIVYLLLR